MTPMPALQQRHVYPGLRETREAKEGSMGCTAETARCQVATSYAWDLPKCCRGHVTNLVHTLADAMADAGVRWWLDYGSLLGAVRNPMFSQPGGIIAHDKDADLGFLGEDWDKLLGIVPQWTPDKTAGGKDNEVGEALGFFWIHKLARRKPPRPGQIQYGAGDSIKVCLSRTNRSNVDLFPWYDSPYLLKPDGKRYRYHYVSVDRNKGRQFPEDKLLPLRTIEWEGRELPCPADAEWFCAHRYGRTWKVPLRRNNHGVRVP
jgi:hypothetical protein